MKLALLVALVACASPEQPVENQRRSGDLGLGPFVPGGGPSAGGGTITGGSCSNGKIVTSINTSGVPTCSAPADSYQTDVDWFDDFLNVAASGGTVGIFTGAVTGAGASIVVGSSTLAASTHPGVVVFSTGTAGVGDRASLASQVFSVVFGGGTWTAEWYVMVPTLSTALQEFEIQAGFLDTTSGSDQTDGVYFEYDRGNASAHNASNLDKWICVSSSNSTRTAFVMDGSTVSSASFTTVNAPVTAGTLPDTGWVKLGVVVNAGATEADYFVNGVLSCKVTANIPAASNRSTAFGIKILRSLGATDEDMYLDWFHGHVTLTTPRA